VLKKIAVFGYCEGKRVVVVGLVVDYLLDVVVIRVVDELDEEVADLVSDHLDLQVQQELPLDAESS